MKKFRQEKQEVWNTHATSLITPQCCRLWLSLWKISWKLLSVLAVSPRIRRNPTQLWFPGVHLSLTGGRWMRRRGRLLWSVSLATFLPQWNYRLPLSPLYKTGKTGRECSRVEYHRLHLQICVCLQSRSWPLICWHCHQQVIDIFISSWTRFSYPIHAMYKSNLLSIVSLFSILGSAWWSC